MKQKTSNTINTLSAPINVVAENILEAFGVDPTAENMLGDTAKEPLVEHNTIPTGVRQEKEEFTEEKVVSVSGIRKIAKEEAEESSIGVEHIIVEDSKPVETVTVSVHSMREIAKEEAENPYISD